MWSRARCSSREGVEFRHVCGAECRVADVVGVDGVRATSDVEVAHDVSAEIAHGCRDEALGAPALGDERKDFCAVASCVRGGLCAKRSDQGTPSRLRRGGSSGIRVF